jgi:hypothetical protein
MLSPLLSRKVSPTSVLSSRIQAPKKVSRVHGTWQKRTDAFEWPTSCEKVYFEEVVQSGGTIEEIALVLTKDQQYWGYMASHTVDS